MGEIAVDKWQCKVLLNDILIQLTPSFIVNIYTFSCSFTKGPAQKFFQTIRWPPAVGPVCWRTQLWRWLLCHQGKEECEGCSPTTSIHIPIPPSPQNATPVQTASQRNLNRWQQQRAELVHDAESDTPHANTNDYANFLLEGKMTVRMMFKTESAICFFSEMYLLYNIVNLYLNLRYPKHLDIIWLYHVYTIILLKQWCEMRMFYMSKVNKLVLINLPFIYIHFRPSLKSTARFCKLMEMSEFEWFL